jgi:chemotaxis protein methyltransferase CheR
MTYNLASKLAKQVSSEFFISNVIEPSADMTIEVFNKWRQFIYDKTGIYFQDNKKYLLQNKLLKRIQFLKLNGYLDYLNYLITSPGAKEEMKYLFDAITINETFFFRNQPQLDALVLKIFPEIISVKKNLNQKTVRIWSAASSSGEEAYSVAMVINEFILPKYPDIKFEILGTDISSKALETAIKGIYNEYSIRNMPMQFLKKYFKKIDNLYEILPNIRSMVEFKFLNLNDEIAMMSIKNFDIIFCANVLIYFDKNSKIKVINNLYKILNRPGYLFLGYSESMHGISEAFKIVSFPKTIGYKKE